MAQNNEKEAVDALQSSPSPSVEHGGHGPATMVNASGHVQELDRNFSLWQAAGVALVVGSTWAPLGSSIIVALYNGGAPGVLYELIVVTLFYWVVAACIAELASAIPSSGGVYHWASVTPGKKWGRVVGFFAGYWNCLAWILGAASMSAISGNILVQLYALNHPAFVPQAWHIFVAYILTTWCACLSVCFGNKVMPYTNGLGVFFIIAGVFVTIVVCAAMPGSGGRPPHATSAFVWTEWNAEIGYPNGFVFVAGMLNGAYAMGTPDIASHLAEEIPRPQINVPKVIGLQMVIGFFTAFFYAIAIMYAINDYDALFESPFPIAAIYQQATGSTAGATGLLVVLLFPILLTVTGVYITCGRTLWALARDRATPFPNTLGKVSPKLNMPFAATLTCGGVVTVLGAIYVGSTTAFNAFVGCFILLTTASYTAAILPNLLTKRKNIIYGPFHMKGALGFIMNFVACAYMIVWFVIYNFPYALPTSAQSMNYSCLIFGGLTIFVTVWWFVGARNYKGPQTIGGNISEVEEIRRAASVAETYSARKNEV